MPVDALYRNDFTLTSCDAVVTSVHEDGTFETDRTCFYATSGGQPGDTGIARRADGSAIAELQDTSWLSSWPSLSWQAILCCWLA